MPLLGSRLIREITVAGVAELLHRLRPRGCAEKTVAEGVVDAEHRNAVLGVERWIAQSPVEKLERCERPRPDRHPGRGAKPVTRDGLDVRRGRLQTKDYDDVIEDT